VTTLSYHSATITTVAGHFTKFMIVVQLNADVCWRSIWIAAPSQPYDWRNIWNLVCLRNVRSEDQARVSGGRLFYARPAATRKARSERVPRRVDGTCSVVVSADDLWCRPQAVRQVRRCCAVHTMVRQNTQPELDSLRDAQPLKLRGSEVVCYDVRCE